MVCLITPEANRIFLGFCGAVLGSLDFEVSAGATWMLSTHVRGENASIDVRRIHRNASLVVRQKCVCLGCSETKPADASGVVRQNHLMPRV